MRMQRFRAEEETKEREKQKREEERKRQLDEEFWFSDKYGRMSYSQFIKLRSGQEEESYCETVCRNFEKEDHPIMSFITGLACVVISIIAIDFFFDTSWQQSLLH